MRPSWSGELSLVGFPIKVAAYQQLKSKQADSLKMLDPEDLLPVKQQLVNSRGEEVERALTRRGVEVNGGIKPLSAEQLEQIQEGERSRRVEALDFPSRSSVPIHLATTHYVLAPPEKSPEAGESLNVLWNGLKAADRVLILELTMRAGARPRLMAVEALDTGLVMHELPYVTDFQDKPAWVPSENEQAAALLERFVEVSGNTDDFAHESWQDHYAERRSAIIEAALRGETITPEASDTPAVVAPDLMAALAAQLEAEPAKPKSPRPKRAKKVEA